METKPLYSHGFTLIEILVVVAIIGVLSALILPSLNDARAKTRDTQRKIEFNQIVRAMNFYYDKHGHYPPNNTGGDLTYAVNFNNMAQELVNEGFLSKVPISPCGSTCHYNNGGYAYYNYGLGNALGAMIITSMLTLPPSTTGVPPSCRQSLYPTSFCYSNNTRIYCMCFSI
jgi:general secretion pathway protein G